jgi:hypothetical protein
MLLVDVVDGLLQHALLGLHDLWGQSHYTCDMSTRMVGLYADIVLLDGCCLCPTLQAAREGMLGVPSVYQEQNGTPGNPPTVNHACRSSCSCCTL